MTDYSVFANPDFDAHEYANAILSGEPYPPQQSTTKSVKTFSKAFGGIEPAKEDISVALSKLDFGIEDVSKQLKNVVTTHHEELLVQAAGVNELETSLTSVRGGLGELESSVEKLRLKIRTPYQSLQSHVNRLQRLQQALDVLRRISRFVVLARRLESQMSEMAAVDGVSEASANGTATPSRATDHEEEKERTIVKAALSIAELTALLDVSPEAETDKSYSPENRPDPAATEADENESIDGSMVPLRSIHAVAAHVPFIEASRARITTEMENMVVTGLATLNQSLLASSLQTAHNLRVLPEVVQNLVLDLSGALESRIRAAFDLSQLSKEALGKDPAPSSQSLIYKSRIRTEPTNLTAPQWTALLWTRLENLVEELTSCCIKVYALEKVLKLKKDPLTGTVFLDEAMKVLENLPRATFWSSLGRALEKQCKDAVKGSSFIQQTLSTGYPRLLRLFQEFFAKIAVHTDTVYSQASQSPETILVLRALSTFEGLYLARVSNKLNETVGQAFAGGSRSPPGINEGVNISRSIANELDSAKFDPLLLQAVARNAISSLELMLNRADGMLVRDRSAFTLAGPTATPQQILNGQVASMLHHCWSRLQKLDEEYQDSVTGILKPQLNKIRSAYEKVTDPLLTAIKRELGVIIARVHRIDFGKNVDPMAGMGGGASLYMKDLSDKLSFLKMEILSKLNLGDEMREWTTAIVKYVLRTFVLHVSIVKPLGESGKLQLTSDMTELEFAVSAFMTDSQSKNRGADWSSVADDYRALRAMRPLLFLENGHLASTQDTIGLPPLIVLHHIIVRSPIPLPHTLHGWQEAEYVRWVEEHSEEEALTLIDGGLSHWEKIMEVEGKDPSAAVEYVELARTVLNRARSV
ncbi:hypothetical protein NEOLEDRAFT_1177385 [Neolentinus lepideus HHB14362 ss-1]|uniref:Conserved oligomeric Golgi complex subunit 5 n=1 Tax=Neolentinus lepideus HHB14362 ss-1 TaxID=1314782 RepID=A0A165TKI8_9AGAM|nr:hypothetical protein NEOLEDRAFT_1177385 [Neolentinus lepideus HHB14362 ss-1]